MTQLPGEQFVITVMVTARPDVGFVDKPGSNQQPEVSTYRKRI